MKKFLKLICTLSFFMFCMIGCKDNIPNTHENNANNKQQIEYQKLSNMEFSDIIVDSKLDNKDEIYNLNKDNTFTKTKSIDNIMDLFYNNKKNIFVSVVKVKDEDKNIHDKIVIENGNKTKELNDSYYYLDVKMSQDSSKIAYRSFKDSSFNDAEGMKIYDIENMKSINITSNVLVSGNVYGWLDSNTILYYGAVPGVKNSNKIYMYDIKNNKEDIYFDKIDNFCKYFLPVSNNGVLLLENLIDDYSLVYYDFISNKKYTLSDAICEIDNAVLDSKNNKVFFIGRVFNEENYYLYEIDLKQYKINRISYDLPRYVCSQKGLALDKDGRVFFIGYSDNSYENDVYMYTPDSNTISLISDISSDYKIYYSK